MNTIYVTMTSAHELVHLPVEISGFQKGCALFEISGNVYPYIDDVLYLCVDFIDESIIGPKMIPILRRIRLHPNKNGSGGFIDHTFNKMLWISCNRSPIKELRVYISDAQGNLPPFVDCHIKCTLVIIPHT